MPCAIVAVRCAVKQIVTRGRVVGGTASALQDFRRSCARVPAKRYADDIDLHADEGHPRRRSRRPARCVEGSAQVTLELAQSHVFPAPARTWETAGLSRYGDIDLHLVGNREALTIFELGSLAESSASMHVTNEERGSDDVEIALSPPSQIPGTYGDDNAGSAMDGEPYSTTAWTGTIPADLIKKGLSIKVTYPGVERTWSNFTVGAPTRPGIVSSPSTSSAQTRRRPRTTTSR